jgi:hypothetical protein
MRLDHVGLLRAVVVSRLQQTSVRAACKRYKIKTVIRKATWTVLLFLLVSAQALAATCAVRCDSMMAVSPGASSNMTDCHGMMSQQTERGNGSDALLVASHCAAHVCQGDLTPLQSRASHETASHAGSLFGMVIECVRYADGLGATTRLRFGFVRRGRFIPPFDPLNSSLRV